jgi:acetyl-CoA acetyltransferase
MSTQAFKDSVAVVGVGNTDFGRMYRDLDRERSSYQLGAFAFKAALEDAGLKREDVDGLLTMRVPSYIRMAQVLGMRDLSVVKSFEGSGRFSGIMINSAAAMIHAGMAKTIACIYGNDGRSTGARYGGEEGGGSETLILYALRHDLAGRPGCSDVAALPAPVRRAAGSPRPPRDQ